MRITSNAGIRGIWLTRGEGNILSRNILLHSRALCGTDCLHELWCLFSDTFLFCNLGAKCQGWMFICLQGPCSNKDNTAQSGYNLGTNVGRKSRGMPSLKIILSFILKVNEDRFFMVPRIPLLNHWMKVKGIILATYPQIFTKLSDVYWGTLCLVSWHHLGTDFQYLRKLLCQMVAALVHINITVTRNFHNSEKVMRLSNMAKWTVTHWTRGPWFIDFHQIELLNMKMSGERSEMCDWGTMSGDNKRLLTILTTTFYTDSDHRKFT